MGDVDCTDEDSDLVDIVDTVSDTWNDCAPSPTLTDEELDEMEIKCCLWDADRIARLRAEVTRLRAEVKRLQIDLEEHINEDRG